jgi:hypothetical protein
MKWTINDLQGVTFYGFGSNFVGPGAQQSNEGNCWARSMAALLGVSWSFVAMHAALDDIKLGQDNTETAATVKQVNAEIEKTPKLQQPYRLATAGRWFGQSWSKDQVQAAYPRAVGLTNHWIVVLGIGFDAQDKPAWVCYWDTDNVVKYGSYNGFTGPIPELCYVREAR